MLPMGLHAGVTLGRYQLVRLVGEGAGGSVFEANDAVLSRRVAVKVLRIPVPRRRACRTCTVTVLARRPHCVTRATRSCRRGARLRRPRGGALPRHGVRRGREPGAVIVARGSAPARAGRRHSAADPLRGRRAAREPRRAPRHQTGKHASSARRRNSPEAGGLRRLPFCRGIGRADAVGSAHRDRRVHGARARAGRAGCGGGERSVRHRCRPLRVRDRPKAVPRVDGLRGDARSGQHRASRRRHHERPRPSAGLRRHRASRDAPRPGTAIRSVDELAQALRPWRPKRAAPGGTANSSSPYAAGIARRTSRRRLRGRSVVVGRKDSSATERSRRPRRPSLRRAGRSDRTRPRRGRRVVHPPRRGLPSRHPVARRFTLGPGRR